jgi:hypothetical protein
MDRAMQSFGSNGVILRAPVGETLTLERIAQKCPSVFAEEKHESRSAKYTYIPTYELLQGFMKADLFPVEVRQGGSRDVAKRQFTKHLMRFRPKGTQVKAVGDSFPEIVLLNSHDGTSSYQLMNGWFRLVCLNGMTVCDSEGLNIKVPHRGDVLGDVIEAAYKVLSTVDTQADKIEEMTHLQLTGPEQAIFARSAIPLRFDADREVEPASVLRVRRYGDNGSDLWSTFNRVQENLIRGGVQTLAYDEHNRRQVRRSRAVNGISEDVKLNQALWTLAEEMRKLKAA